jgi:hypothetical protein
MVFKIPLRLPLCINSFLFPFFWGGWLHLLWIYCANDLFWELGSCCLYHCLEIIGRFSSVLIGGDKCEQFRFTRIPSSLEVNVGTSSFSGSIMHTFFEQLAKKGVEKGVDRLQKNILERLNTTIPFPTSFLTCLQIYIVHIWGLA